MPLYSDFVFTDRKFMRSMLQIFPFFFLNFLHVIQYRDNSCFAFNCIISWKNEKMIDYVQGFRYAFCVNPFVSLFDYLKVCVYIYIYIYIYIHICIYIYIYNIYIYIYIMDIYNVYIYIYILSILIYHK